MREATNKVLLGFLAITLVMPAFFLARPQKAEALVSLAQCFAAKTAATALATAELAAAIALTVGTNDAVTTYETAWATAGAEFKSCFLDSLVKIIAKTLLHTFTQSIVNWINTGFQGSPSFITNPEGFLSDVADKTIGRVIEDISPLLCTPFRLDIRFALGLNLSLNTKEEVHCRLSDVIANVRGAYDGFVAGAAGSGNLSNWIHIAGTQQNNPYGAYIATTNKVSVGITTATGQQIKLLDWGKGFKSWRSCKRWGPDVKEGNPARVVRKGPCIEEGPIKTPGSIIQEQTTGALGTTFRELELADEIDEVVGALINQLLVKAITGAGGLLGASKGDITSGGQSAADALLTDPYKGVASTNATPPTGINCRLRYYPSTVEHPAGSGVFVPDNSLGADQVWTDNLQKRADTDPSFVHATYIKDGKAEDVKKPPREPWDVYFTTVRDGCENEWSSLIDGTSKGALGSYSGGSTKTPDSKPPAPESRTGNLATGKLATQSSNCNQFWARYVANPFASVAIDGNVSPGSSYYPTFSCTQATKNGIPEWWEVDLETNGQNKNRESVVNEIKEILIFRPAGEWDSDANGEYINTLRDGTFTVSILGSSRNTVYSIPIQPRTSSELAPIYTYNQPIYTIPIPSGKRGRYVRIEQTGVSVSERSASRQLIIAEVEIFGTQTRLDSSGNAPAPAAALLSVAFQPPLKTLRGFLGGESLTLPSGESIVLATNKETTGVTLRIMLKAGKELTTLMPAPWKQYFTMPSFAGTGVVLSYTAANKTGTTPPFIVGNASDRRINPLVCTDAADALLQGKCDKDAFGVFTQRQSDSWITFARDLTATPGKPITVSITDAMLAQNGFTKPASVQMIIEASYTDEATKPQTATYTLNFTIN